MPKDQQMPRQRPVSCSFCRKRKLRCSRELPECANCKSRGVQCDLGDIVKQSSFTVEDSSRSEILERLQRLEQLLAAQQSRTSVLPTQETAAPQLPSTSQPSELDSQIQSLNQDVALLESIYLDDQFPKVMSSCFLSLPGSLTACSMENCRPAESYSGHALSKTLIKRGFGSALPIPLCLPVLNQCGAYGFQCTLRHIYCCKSTSESRHNFHG
jgi:hypothetical protein